MLREEVMNEEKNIDQEELKDTFDEMNKDSENIHIHKTGDDGTEVDIDVDKKNKEVEINIDKSKGKKGKDKVNVSFSGIHVKGEDGEEVNVKFLPWIIFGVCVALAIISLLLFTIYSIFKLFA